MPVDFDKFLNWAEKRFDSVVVKGDEIKINSIFCDDHKHHLYCNPYGGKQGRPYGVFRCWKSDRRGSLASLIMLVDKCDFSEALEILGTENISLAELERKVQEFFDNKPEEKSVFVSTDIAIPENTYPIVDLSDDNYFKVQAEVHLMGRNLPIDDLLVCTDGKYVNRIVIPYYDKNRKLIYFNCRYLGKNEKIPRYLGPPTEVGIGKANVIYVPVWPQEGERMYITEGEFDALTLKYCDLYSAALGGKEISETQIEYLRGYKPTICIDNDIYGKKALPKIGDALLSKGFTQIRYIRPPNLYKDWNEMYQQHNKELVKAYIQRNEQDYDNTTSTMFKYNSL